MEKYLEMPWGIEDTIENLREVKEVMQERVMITNLHGRGEKDTKEIAFDFDRAIAALEKQIPKRPVLTSGESLVHINKGDKPHEWKVNKWQEWCCPVCGWFVGERFNVHRHDGSVHSHDQRKSKYCNECGQAIDWKNLQYADN